jgi:hypothetical protein
LLHQLNIAEKTQTEIKNIKEQKRRRAGALQAFVTQRFFIYVKYFWQGLVGGAIYAPRFPRGAFFISMLAAQKKKPPEKGSFLR